MIRLNLPHFRDALKRNKDALSDETLRRYSNGVLPKALRVIVERPELVEALLADSRALTSATPPTSTPSEATNAAL